MTEIKPLYWIIVPGPDGYRGELFDTKGRTVWRSDPFAKYDLAYWAISRELRRRDPHKENNEPRTV